MRCSLVLCQEEAILMPFSLYANYGKYLAKNRLLYFAFVDLEKALDRVQKRVPWWVMRKTSVKECIVRLVQ